MWPMRSFSSLAIIPFISVLGPLVPLVGTIIAVRAPAFSAYANRILIALSISWFLVDRWSSWRILLWVFPRRLEQHTRDCPFDLHCSPSPFRRRFLPMAAPGGPADLA